MDYDPLQLQYETASAVVVRTRCIPGKIGGISHDLKKTSENIFLNNIFFETKFSYIPKTITDLISVRKVIHQIKIFFYKKNPCPLYLNAYQTLRAPFSTAFIFQLRIRY